MHHGTSAPSTAIPAPWAAARRGRRLLAAAALLVGVAVPALTGAATASAAPASGLYNCTSGVDAGSGNTWGWGVCSGNGTFALRLNCTYGQNKTSAPIIVRGGQVRTDIQCPLGTTIRNTQINILS
ncbi:hypothetical protein ACIPPM_04060 [Streptomyces sp. NPDC090119]|uniref:hypothetical protein n=1 Tax=Streptomyces sp. NPDC090119 TaxID=3365951 RepID=UPI00382EEC75